MLILTRRVGEAVMIGDEVTVTVLRVKGNQVRLGVTRRKPSRFSVRRSSIASSARVPRLATGPRLAAGPRLARVPRRKARQHPRADRGFALPALTAPV